MILRNLEMEVKMSEIRPDVLYVRMLGGFSVQYGGKLIAGGSKSTDSQFTDLLQILIHSGDTGVTRDKLEELLFYERDISNVHHALQSVIYNSKKKLEKAGLPKDTYIVQKKGVFFWQTQIPTVLDTQRFTSLLDLARSKETVHEKTEALLNACYLYTGEFLPTQASVIWAAREARRYKELFCEAVEETTELLRESQDYFHMRELGLFAAKVDPLADWETITMAALASLNRYEEALQLYEATVDYYLTEQGLRPSKKLMEQFGRLGEQMQYKHAALDMIKEELVSTDTDGPGGYLCTYPVFQGIYQMVKRMLERGGQSVYIMLCTVVDSKGNPMKEGEMLTELSGRLIDAVHATIRRGDALTRYGKGQCLVLLINTTQENCKVIQRRINAKFIIGRQRTGVEYHVSSVFWNPEDAPLPGLKS